MRWTIQAYRIQSVPSNSLITPTWRAWTLHVHLALRLPYRTCRNTSDPRDSLLHALLLPPTWRLVLVPQIIEDGFHAFWLVVLVGLQVSTHLGCIWRLISRSPRFPFLAPKGAPSDFLVSTIAFDTRFPSTGKYASSHAKNAGDSFLQVKRWVITNVLLLSWEVPDGFIAKRS